MGSGVGRVASGLLVLAVLLCGCRRLTAREARHPGLRSSDPDVERTTSETPFPELDPQTLQEERGSVVRAALGSVGEAATDLDCSSFVQKAYSAAGVVLPRTVLEQLRAGLPIEDAELLPGDLLFFAFEKRPADHVGIYLGHESFAHVSSVARAVRIDRLEMAPFVNAKVASRRFLP